MLKKLTEEKLLEVLEAGIAEFAEHGLEQTGMNNIAKRAGISVGVLYKYYENKDDFFAACVRHCTDALEDILKELCTQEKKPLQYAKELINAMQQYSCQHKSYIRLYYEVTRTGDPVHAAEFARQIEGVSARLYTDIIRKEQEAGDVRGDLDPKLFAFFFDNLLMMMQFSYCCPYYQERFKLFAGEDMSGNPEAVTSQLLKFLESAFTLEQADILHGQQKGTKTI